MKSFMGVMYHLSEAIRNFFGVIGSIMVWVVILNWKARYFLISAAVFKSWFIYAAVVACVYFAFSLVSENRPQRGGQSSN